MGITTTTPLRFDGMFGHLFQWTEVDESTASYGATFCTKTNDEETVAAKRESKRIEFEKGKSRR